MIGSDLVRELSENAIIIIIIIIICGMGFAMAIWDRDREIDSDYSECTALCATVTRST